MHFLQSFRKVSPWLCLGTQGLTVGTESRIATNDPALCKLLSKLLSGNEYLTIHASSCFIDKGNIDLFIQEILVKTFKEGISYCQSIAYFALTIENWTYTVTIANTDQAATLHQTQWCMSVNKVHVPNVIIFIHYLLILYYFINIFYVLFIHSPIARSGSGQVVLI